MFILKSTYIKTYIHFVITITAFVAFWKILQWLKNNYRKFKSGIRKRFQAAHDRGFSQYEFECKYRIRIQVLYCLLNKQLIHRVNMQQSERRKKKENYYRHKHTLNQIPAKKVCGRGTIETRQTDGNLWTRLEALWTKLPPPPCRIWLSMRKKSTNFSIN